MKISIIETRTLPTILIEEQNKKIIFHSKYDPIREVNAWCENALANINEMSGIIIIGLGAGYHLKQLADSLPKHKISVIEFNQTYYDWFVNSPFYNSIQIYKNIELNLFCRMSYSDKQQIINSLKSSNLLIHQSGLDVLPNEYNNVREILEDIDFKKKSIQNQIQKMNQNFNMNIKLNDKGIKDLKNTYEGKPMILISAGPSLNKQITLLKRIREENNVILGAVGTAIKPLLSNNIIPHFFSIIDPNPETYTQLTDTNIPNITLFYLSTAYHGTILLHKGPRRILWQEGYTDAENMSKKLGDPLIQSGGSVATALLDLMIYLGARSVALVGQDLAYTGGFTHANNAHANRMIDSNSIEYRVLNYFQNGVVATGRNLTIYRKWFEEYAKKNSHLNLYNCTEGGAYIKNWNHIPLQEYIKLK